MTEIAFDNSYARLPETFFARLQPAPVPTPEVVAINHGLAAELGLDAEWLASEAGLSMLSGNRMPRGADPIALVYAGHQFGGFSPRLGDGRALLVGEIVGRDGIRRDLQLQGSGLTPFSRQGDGKSPLGPVIREYLVSEAMAALGIPTTRALSAIATGESVQRETALPGGILMRVAQSHVRVGTFEYFAESGDRASLERLADYVLERHYPEARSGEDPYRGLLEAIVARQADLIARWMQVGFVHGVMNTDNMQIAGETIDFGPCAFMESFDPATVFSSIDTQGRYAWGNQPGIGQWNLTRLAEAMLPLLAADQDEAVATAEAALACFAPVFNQALIDGFRGKLGLAPVALEADVTGEEGAPDALIQETFDALQKGRVDFTRFFRELTRLADAAAGAEESVLALFEEAEPGRRWLERWRSEVELDAAGRLPAERLEVMRRSNPIFIPRNHRVEEAIQASYRGDHSVFARLHRVLSQPFEEQPENAEYESPAAPEEVVHRTFCGT